ncbi:MAG: TPM domain-containing protein [Candidatus Pacebacteria bacterium]|nr:TPM domain-containing protein [Candidatus Paceibacterota bacterium]
MGFLLVLILGSVCGLNAQTIPAPVPGKFVQDMANVLSDSEEAQLEQKVRAFQAQTDTQIVIVTIPSLQGYPEILDYANRLFDQWKVGVKGVDKGVIVAVAPNDRQSRIHVGYGLEGDLTDGFCGETLRTVGRPFFKDTKWFGGLNAVTDAIIQRLGTKTQAQRAEEAKAQAEAYKARVLEEKRLADIKARESDLFWAKVGDFFLYVVLPFGVLIGLIGFLFIRAKTRRELREAIESLTYHINNYSKAVSTKIRVAEEIVDASAAMLDVMRTIYKPSALAEAEKALQWAQFSIKQEKHLFSRLESPQNSIDQLKQLKRSIDEIDEKVDEVGDRANQVLKTKESLESNRRSVQEVVGKMMGIIDGLTAARHSAEAVMVPEINKIVATAIMSVEDPLKKAEADLRADGLQPDWLFHLLSLNSVVSMIQGARMVIDNHLEDIKEAKAGVGKVPSEVASAKKKGESIVGDSDVSASARAKFKSALKLAQQFLVVTPPQGDLPTLSWHQNYLVAKDSLDSAIGSMQHDIDEAERRRKEAAEEEERRLARIAAAAVAAAALKNRQESSRNDSGSSFSSPFGGGMSGGGGASDKW